MHTREETGSGALGAEKTVKELIEQAGVAAGDGVVVAAGRGLSVAASDGVWVEAGEGRDSDDAGEDSENGGELHIC